MHKVIHKKFNPIFSNLSALFGCLTTLFTYASAHLSTQSTGSLSVKEIEDFEFTKVEDSNQAAYLNMLLPIKIGPGQRADISKALTLLPLGWCDNSVGSSNQHGDIKVAEFSIKNAVFYQNNIHSDNVSIDISLCEAKYVSLRQISNRTQTDYVFALND